MHQITWRAPDELADRVRWSASQAGQSVNAFVTRVLDAATDPGLTADDALRVRERLARAGLLAPSGPVRGRPAPAAVAAAAHRAARGTSLAAVVEAERR